MGILLVERNLVLDSLIVVVVPNGDQHNIGYQVLAESIYLQIDSERPQLGLFQI